MDDINLVHKSTSLFVTGNALFFPSLLCKIKSKLHTTLKLEGLMAYVLRNILLWKPNGNRWRHNDIIIKTMVNSDLCKSRQIVYHLKGVDNVQKWNFYYIRTILSKVIGIYLKF